LILEILMTSDKRHESVAFPLKYLSSQLRCCFVTRSYLTFFCCIEEAC
jgi:hypothetical protein